MTAPVPITRDVLRQVCVFLARSYGYDVRVTLYRPVPPPRDSRREAIAPYDDSVGGKIEPNSPDGKGRLVRFRAREIIRARDIRPGYQLADTPQSHPVGWTCPNCGVMAHLVFCSEPISAILNDVQGWALETHRICLLCGQRSEESRFASALEGDL